jgi:hypothetical protein
MTPEGHLPLSGAVSELAHQIGGDVMMERKPEVLVRIEAETAAAIARSKAVYLAPIGSIRQPPQGAIKPVGPAPTAEQIASALAAPADVRAAWVPIAERQQRAWEEARRRLRVELAEGRMQALGIGEDGAFRPVGQPPWRVAKGEAAMVTGRLAGLQIFIPEAEFRVWCAPPTAGRMDDKILKAIVAGIARQIADETGNKPTQRTVVEGLKNAGLSEAEANRGARMIPTEYKRGRGDHDNAPPTRLAAKSKA